MKLRTIDIEPIPVTKEWLIEKGFKPVQAPTAYGYDCNKWNDKGTILRGAWSDHTKGYYLMDFLENGTHKKVEYTYQVQMIWYRLTGEWL